MNTETEIEIEAQEIIDRLLKPGLSKPEAMHQEIIQGSGSLIIVRIMPDSSDMGSVIGSKGRNLQALTQLWKIIEPNARLTIQDPPERGRPRERRRGLLDPKTAVGMVEWWLAEAGLNPRVELLENGRPNEYTLVIEEELDQGVLNALARWVSVVANNGGGRIFIEGADSGTAA